MLDVLEYELRAFRGRLHEDVSVVEERAHDSLDVARDVLDDGQVQLGGDAIEQSLLLDIDDPMRGDDPGVEVVVGELDEADKPDRQGIDAGGYDDDRPDQRMFKPGAYPVPKVDADRRGNGEHEDGGRAEGSPCEPLAA